MAASEFPYKGTWAELQQVQREIAELQDERAELNKQEQVLQEHRTHILNLIRDNARGGKP